MSARELTVVCTDRGAHTPRTLARLTAKLQGGRVVIGRVTGGRRYRRDGRVIAPRSTPGADDARRRDDDGLTFAFTCPTCGRNRPMRDDRLAALADSRARWRVSSLDISHLPS